MLRATRTSPGTGRPGRGARLAAAAGAALLLSCASAAPPPGNRPDLDPLRPSLGREAIPADMPADVRRLVEQLYDEDQWVMAAAAKALGEMGPEAASAAPFLASLLDGHWAQPGPNAAAAALVRIGKGGFDAVAAAAATSGEARRRAVLVMSRLDGPRTVPLAVDMLTAGTGGDFCLAALRAIGERARDHVFRAAASPDAAMRRGAAAALPAFSSLPLRYRGIDGYGGGDRARQDVCRTQAAVELLLKLVGDGEAGVRAAALRSLARLADCRDARMPLADTLRAALRDAAPAVRLTAVGVVLAAAETDKARFDALAPLTGDGDPSVRAAAAAALGSLPGERARGVPLLVKLLADPAAAIRREAAGALGELRATEAEGALLAALTDEARLVQVAAAAALATTAGKAGIDALAALAKGPADPAVRVAAVESLAVLYAAMCARARPGGGRRTAGGSFRPDDSPQAETIFQALSRALADPLADLHIPAIRALARTPPGAGKDLVPLLLEALSSPEEATRLLVVREFLRGGGIRDDRLLEAVHRRILSGKLSAGELEYSCGLLAHWGDARSLPVFRKVLLSGRVKSGAAIGALVAAGGESLDFVLANLGNPNGRVRENVAARLADHLGEAKVRDFVRAGLRGGDENLRAGARRVTALAPRAVIDDADSPTDRLRNAILAGPEGLARYSRHTNDPEAVRAATALLADARGDVRAGAAAVLGTLGDPTATPALRKALADPDATVRARAAEAIAALGDRAAAPALGAALGDPAEAVRESAAEALGRLGDPNAAAALVKALGGGDWHLRRAAAAALGSLRCAAGAAALAKALAGDPHWAVRGAAAAALGRIGDRSSAAALTAALNDEHWYVRRAARESLAALMNRKPAPDLRAERRPEH